MKNVEFFDWQLNCDHPLSWIAINVGKKVHPHKFDMHSAVHLVIVLEGRHNSRCGNTELSMSAGMIFLSAPWEPHCTLPGDGKKLFLINIDPDALKKFFFVGFDRIQSLFGMPPAERLAFLNRLDRLNAHTEEILNALHTVGHPLQPLYVWDAVLRLLMAYDPPVTALAASANSYRRLLPALKELGGRPLSAAEAARRCNLSASRFAVIFKNVFGLNFARYERLFRLNSAAEAIRRGATLKEAAVDWGFCDKSHLARLLKRQDYGIYSDGNGSF